MSCIPRSQLADVVDSAETTTLLRKIKKKNLLIPYTQRSIPPPISHIQADSLTVSSVSTCSHYSSGIESRKVEQLGKNVRIMQSRPQERQKDAILARHPQQSNRKGKMQWHREAPIPEERPVTASFNGYLDEQTYNSGDIVSLSERGSESDDSSSRHEPTKPQSRLLNSRSGFSSRTPITKNPPDQAQWMPMEGDNMSSKGSRYSDNRNDDDESDLISREDDIISAAMSRKSQSQCKSVDIIETCPSEDLVSREDEIRSAAASRASQRSNKKVIKNIALISSDDQMKREDNTSSKMSVLSDPILQNRSSEERNPSATGSQQRSPLDHSTGPLNSKRNSSLLDRYSSCNDSVNSELSNVSATLSERKVTVGTLKTKPATEQDSTTEQHQNSKNGNRSVQIGKGKKSHVSFDVKESVMSKSDGKAEQLAQTKTNETAKGDNTNPVERSIQNDIMDFLDSLSLISSTSIFSSAKKLSNANDATDSVQKPRTSNQKKSVSTENRMTETKSVRKNNQDSSSVDALALSATNVATDNVIERISNEAKTSENRRPAHAKISSQNNLDLNSHNEQPYFCDNVQSDVSDVSATLSATSKGRGDITLSDTQKDQESRSNRLKHHNHSDPIASRKRSQVPSRTSKDGALLHSDNLDHMIAHTESQNRRNSSHSEPDKINDDKIANKSPMTHGGIADGLFSEKCGHSYRDEYDDGVSELSSVSAFLSQRSNARRRVNQKPRNERFSSRRRDPPTLSEEIDEEEEEEEQEVVQTVISDVSSVSAQIRLPTKKINVQSGTVNRVISDMTESLASESWNATPNKNFNMQPMLPIVTGLDVTPQERSSSRRRRRRPSQRSERRSSSESSGQRAPPPSKACSPPQVVDNIPRRQTVDPPVAIRISRDPSVSSKSTNAGRSKT